MVALFKGDDGGDEPEVESWWMAELMRARRLGRVSIGSV